MLKNGKSEKITATRPQPKIFSTLAGARGKVLPLGAAMLLSQNLVQFGNSFTKFH